MLVGENVEEILLIFHVLFVMHELKYNFLEGQRIKLEFYDKILRDC